MVQAVTLRPLTVEDMLRTRVSPCEIWDGQRSTETGSSPSSSVHTVNVISPWLTILIYHLGDEE
jgi:hypothetical protein